LSYHLSFQKNMGVLNFFLCVYIIQTSKQASGDNNVSPAVDFKVTWNTRLILNFYKI